MIEITEAIPFAKQADSLLKNQVVRDCVTMHSPHKYCFMDREPADFQKLLIGQTIKACTSSAHYIRILFESGKELAFGEDIHIRYNQEKRYSDKNQLVLIFDGGASLEFKTGLYGFFFIGDTDELSESNAYYKVALEAIPPLDPNFTYEHFLQVTEINQQKGSIKQALATLQHIPGVGNGALQDILFAAKLRPMKKVSTLTHQQSIELYNALQNKIAEMISGGGRNSVKNFLGENGKYECIISNDRIHCPICGTSIKKVAYLGGRVIFCPIYQIE